MRWLDRLRTIEKRSDLLGGELQKPQKAPPFSFCSASPQECEIPQAARQIANPVVPADWTAGVARLQTMARPPMIGPDRRQQVIADAGRFLDRWGAQAAALGWTTLDVFGAHPTHPLQRLDCAGLILLLHGDELVAITADTARTRKRSRAILTYYRRPRPGAVPLWELG
jgi:hypothetical protein